MGRELTQMLKNAQVRWLRVLWCDNANVIRAKAVHVGALNDYLEHGVGVTAAHQALPVIYDTVIPETGLGPVGEVRLLPDWPTFTPLPYAPGHARVMGDLHQDGWPWPLCPRGFLRRMAARAEDEGLEVRAAFEYEFYLLRLSGDAVAPADDTVFAATLAMDLNRTVIDEIAEALLRQGIPVEMYYPESGPGQHEISVRYAGPLEAADRQLVFRETAHAVAARHGLKVSFLPKLFADKAGSGCHLHFSLWREGLNLLPDSHGLGGLSALGRSFLAGVLHHLPALMALTTPSPNSYRRIRPHFWSGAFRCWGLDNREAALRVPTNPAGTGTTHVELKTVDGSANPHLALGAVIAAGLDGVRRGLDPGEPVALDPGSLSAAERQARGVEQLPAALDQALGHLEDNAVLRGALGAELARAFLTVRRAEWEALKGLELAEEVKLLLERY